MDVWWRDADHECPLINSWIVLPFFSVPPSDPRTQDKDEGMLVDTRIPMPFHMPFVVSNSSIRIQLSSLAFSVVGFDVPIQHLRPHLGSPAQPPASRMLTPLWIQVSQHEYKPLCSSRHSSRDRLHTSVCNHPCPTSRFTLAFRPSLSTCFVNQLHSVSPRHTDRHKCSDARYKTCRLHPPHDSSTDE
ncbi:hypothetical protein BDN72DRAFT_146721 [Pluteus cervinus]|uniref:Uncharacterized protein n=1 Tax=Pluteus cervinus TaxID=181527 RepID=A0ACD3ALD1_9AGAR|nr:hypothetical protein BDN72DRAFT_146721 [Pluteus cervinus]